MLADFLTGAILSWALPLFVLVVVLVYWAVVVRRHPDQL